jgi:hypothetical protein
LSGFLLGAAVRLLPLVSPCASGVRCRPSVRGETGRLSANGVQEAETADFSDSPVSARFVFYLFRSGIAPSSCPSTKRGPSMLAVGIGAGAAVVIGGFYLLYARVLKKPQ